MKILKVAALSAVFAAQFAFAQFKQTPLPYAYNALEGNIDAQTMENSLFKTCSGVCRESE